MNYNHCKECKGKKECNQPLTGYVDGVRCKFNLRGYYNDEEILKPKYAKFDCDNLAEIKNHINTKHSIYLYGSYGKGKSHALRWMANKYNLRGHAVYVAKVAEFANELRLEVQRNFSTNEAEIPLTTILKNIECLFLDDMGVEKMTEFVAAALYLVIDHRYLKKKPTYISSNYKIGELLALWTEKIGKVKADQLCTRIKTFGAIEIKGKNWRNYDRNLL